MSTTEGMTGRDEDRLLDHQYDGIQEYDNPLPSWWVYLFLLTIAFSAAYWLYYHWGGIGMSERASYEAEKGEFQQWQGELAAAAPPVDEGSLAALVNDAAGYGQG